MRLRTTDEALRLLVQLLEYCLGRPLPVDMLMILLERFPEECGPPPKTCDVGRRGGRQVWQWCGEHIVGECPCRLRLFKLNSVEVLKHQTHGNWTEKHCQEQRDDRTKARAPPSRAEW